MDDADRLVRPAAQLIEREVTEFVWFYPRCKLCAGGGTSYTKEVYDSTFMTCYNEGILHKRYSYYYI